MSAVITKELAVKAVLHSACHVPKVGRKISSLTTSELIWAEDAGFVTVEEKENICGKLPLWVLSGSGSGYGYGYGDGAGYGDGYGYGSGDGEDLGNVILSLLKS